MAPLLREIENQGVDPRTLLKDNPNLRQLTKAILNLNGKLGTVAGDAKREKETFEHQTSSSSSEEKSEHQTDEEESKSGGKKISLQLHDFNHFEPEHVKALDPIGLMRSGYGSATPPPTFSNIPIPFRTPLAPLPPLPAQYGDPLPQPGIDFVPQTFGGPAPVINQRLQAAREEQPLYLTVFPSFPGHPPWMNARLPLAPHVLQGSFSPHTRTYAEKFFSSLQGLPVPRPLDKQVIVSTGTGQIPEPAIPHSVPLVNGFPSVSQPLIPPVAPGAQFPVPSSGVEASGFPGAPRLNVAPPFPPDLPGPVPPLPLPPLGSGYGAIPPPPIHLPIEPGLSGGGFYPIRDFWNSKATKLNSREDAEAALEGTKAESGLDEAKGHVGEARPNERKIPNVVGHLPPKVPILRQGDWNNEMLRIFAIGNQFVEASEVPELQRRNLLTQPQVGRQQVSGPSVGIRPPVIPNRVALPQVQQGAVQKISTRAEAVPQIPVANVSPKFQKPVGLTPAAAQHVPEDFPKPVVPPHAAPPVIAAQLPDRQSQELQKPVASAPPPTQEVPNSLSHQLQQVVQALRPVVGHQMNISSLTQSPLTQKAFIVFPVPKSSPKPSQPPGNLAVPLPVPSQWGEGAIGAGAAFFGSKSALGQISRAPNKLVEPSFPISNFNDPWFPQHGPTSLPNPSVELPFPPTTWAGFTTPGLPGDPQGPGKFPARISGPSMVDPDSQISYFYFEVKPGEERFFDTLPASEIHPDSAKGFDYFRPVFPTQLPYQILMQYDLHPSLWPLSGGPLHGHFNAALIPYKRSTGHPSPNSLGGHGTLPLHPDVSAPTVPELGSGGSISPHPAHVPQPGSANKKKQAE